MTSPQNSIPGAKSSLNLDLKSRNTFGFDASAELAFEITAAEQIPAIVQEITTKKLPWRVLGGGSNVILPKILPGATLLIDIPGIEVIDSNSKSTTIAVGSGVNWHQFVLWTLDHDFYGLENLALIPGTVGAAPIQNIGAYGVRGQATILSALRPTTPKNGPLCPVTKQDCHFAYRDSYFKTKPTSLYCD
jgi:UDP-N-acetylmuramate dehydrogenase